MSYIELAFQSVGRPSVALAARCSRILSAFWVIDRLPDERDTITRSPSCAKVRIFEKRETWSTPALVRESDANTMPASRDIATQYVIAGDFGGAKERDSTC